MQHSESDTRKQTQRVSTQQARSWLGLPEASSTSGKVRNASVSFTADSADVAGGRGASLFVLVETAIALVGLAQNTKYFSIKQETKNHSTKTAED